MTKPEHQNYMIRFFCKHPIHIWKENNLCRSTGTFQIDNTPITYLLRAAGSRSVAFRPAQSLCPLLSISGGRSDRSGQSRIAQIHSGTIPPSTATASIHALQVRLLLRCMGPGPTQCVQTGIRRRTWEAGEADIFDQCERQREWESYAKDLAGRDQPHTHDVSL